jgi:hypothetical protein
VPAHSVRAAKISTSIYLTTEPRGALELKCVTLEIATFSYLIEMTMANRSFQRFEKGG